MPIWLMVLTLCLASGPSVLICCCALPKDRIHALFKAYRHGKEA